MANLSCSDVFGILPIVLLLILCKARATEQCDVSFSVNCDSSDHCFGQCCLTTGICATAQCGAAFNVQNGSACDAECKIATSCVKVQPTCPSDRPCLGSLVCLRPDCAGHRSGDTCLFDDISDAYTICDGVSAPTPTGAIPSDLMSRRLIWYNWFGRSDPTVSPPIEEMSSPLVASNPYTQAKLTTSPTKHPTASPTADATASPTNEPTASPTAEPTGSPTVEPTRNPTVEPTRSPTAASTADQTAEPTASPTVMPSDAPTSEPTTSEIIASSRAESMPIEPRNKKLSIGLGVGLGVGVPVALGLGLGLGLGLTPSPTFPPPPWHPWIPHEPSVLTSTTTPTDPLTSAPWSASTPIPEEPSVLTSTTMPMDPFTSAPWLASTPIPEEPSVLTSTTIPMDPFTSAPWPASTPMPIQPSTSIYPVPPPWLPDDADVITSSAVPIDDTTSASATAPPPWEPDETEEPNETNSTTTTTSTTTATLIMINQPAPWFLAQQLDAVRAQSHVGSDPTLMWRFSLGVCALFTLVALSVVASMVAIGHAEQLPRPGYRALSTG